MALDVIELRAYARAKYALDTAKRPEDIPNPKTNPMIARVWEVMAEIDRREKEARQRGYGSRTRSKDNR